MTCPIGLPGIAARSRNCSRGIKDEALTEEARRIEATADASPAQSRAQLRAAIERVYTLPA